MKVPTIHGYIDRRILINFTADPVDVQKMLPAPFRPKVFKGKAIVGICLIRLRQIKPKGLPSFLGISSENGAHRIAVEWDKEGRLNEGVYIPRRDTSSAFNAIVGGRLFPGKHHLTKFNVQEEANQYHIDFTSSDDTHILLDGEESAEFDKQSIFGSLEQASDFFKGGAEGYSPNGKKMDGLKLETYHWIVNPLKVSKVHSSFFEDGKKFRKGSIQFDNALLMRNIEHEWKSLPDL